MTFELSGLKIYVYDSKIVFVKPKSWLNPHIIPHDQIMYRQITELRLNAPGILPGSMGSIKIDTIGNYGRATEHTIISFEIKEWVSARELLIYIQRKIIPSDVLYVLNGLSEMLWIYEDKIVFIRRGFGAFLAHGLSGNKTLFFHNITSLQLRKATRLARYLQFSIPGGHESNAGLHAATFDENSIKFTMLENNIAQTIHDFIEEKIIKSHRH